MDDFFVGTVKVQAVAVVEQAHRRSQCEDDFEEIFAPSNNIPDHVPKNVCFEECNKENDVLACFKLLQCVQTSASMCIMS